MNIKAPAVTRQERGGNFRGWCFELTGDVVILCDTGMILVLPVLHAFFCSLDRACQFL